MPGAGKAGYAGPRPGGRAGAETFMEHFFGIGFPSAERARGTGLLHAKRARCRWILSALKCFKGAGGPHLTPALIVHPTVVPCASTAHPNQRVDFTDFSGGRREAVLLFAALWISDRKRRLDPKCDFARLENRAILHRRGQAGNATAATVSTCCAGPPLALRSWRITRRPAGRITELKRSVEALS